MSIKDSIGGWKDNAYNYKSSKGCTTFKNFMGKAWTPIMDGLGVKNATCPIPAVTKLLFIKSIIIISVLYVF